MLCCELRCLLRVAREDIGLGKSRIDARDESFEFGDLLLEGGDALARRGGRALLLLSRSSALACDARRLTLGTPAVAEDKPAVILEIAIERRDTSIGDEP